MEPRPQIDYSRFDASHFPDEFRRADAICELSRAPLTEDLAYFLLETAFHDASDIVRSTAQSAFSRHLRRTDVLSCFPPNTIRNMVDKIVLNLSAEDAETRAAAASMVGHFGTYATAAIHDLIKLIGEAGHPRDLAIISLGDIVDVIAHEALPLLIGAMPDTTPLIQQPICELMVRLAARNDALVVQALRDGLGHPEIMARLSAAEALLRLGVVDTEVLKVLKEVAANGQYSGQLSAFAREELARHESAEGSLSTPIPKQPRNQRVEVGELKSRDR